MKQVVGITRTLNLSGFIDNKQRLKDNIKGSQELIEKAEGARGGKVIGHTKSGKPIYENAAKKESEKKKKYHTEHGGESGNIRSIIAEQLNGGANEDDVVKEHAGDDKQLQKYMRQHIEYVKKRPAKEN